MDWFRLTFTEDQLARREELAFLKRFLTLQLHPNCPKHLVMFRPVTEDTYPITSVIYFPPNAYPYMNAILAGAERCEKPDKASVYVDAGRQADFDFWFA